MAREKDPGTRFPFINLEKAIERAKQLYAEDPQGRPMAVPTAFAAWNYSEKSSGGHQTVAALKMYGLLEDQGANEDRRVRLSDEARTYFLDEREEERERLLKEFALRPRLIAALYRDDDWGASPPADNIARSHLKLERKLNEQSARSLLSIYKDNLAFANIKGSDKIRSEQKSEAAGDSADSDPNVGRVDPPPPPPNDGSGKVKMMENERVVFVDESHPTQYLKLVARGEIDQYLLDALDNYVQRQKKRISENKEKAPH